MFSEHFSHYAHTVFEKRLPLLGKTGEAVKERLAGCPGDIRALLQFYYGCMPLSDAFTYDFDLFYRYAAHAAALREQDARCAALPEEMFLHDVAWYRINSEKIVDCRSFFQEQLSPLICGLDTRRAALAVNYWCASQASYEASDERTQSPLSVYRSGSGRCGEESTFLVTALRSVGIPARQVYAPRWAHCDDNHAWVEVCVDGTWHFMGACEPEEVLDRGWFANAATRALLVYARTFTDYGVEDRIMGRDGCVRFLNVTKHYAQTKPLCIRVSDEEGRPVEGASVSIEILNMAEFCSVLTLTTGAEGTVRLSIGLGDVLVRAWKDGQCAEAVCAAEERELFLKLVGSWETSRETGFAGETVSAGEKRPAVETPSPWRELELRAPKDGAVVWPAPDAAQKAAGRLRLKEAEAVREKKPEAFRAEAAQAAETCPRETDIFLRARGNTARLKEFLDGRDWRHERKELLHSLSDKDFRDLDVQTAQEQLLHQAPLQDRLRPFAEKAKTGESEKTGAVEADARKWRAVESGAARDIFVRYCLCPRIGREELTAFASAVEAYFTEEEKAAFLERPERIWEWEQAHIRYLPQEDYDTLRITPPAALRGLWADETGKRTLFVAVCRTLGIPARLNPVTEQAEYWNGNVWMKASGNGEEAADSGSPARLTLLTDREDQWGYAQTWTIGALSGTGYETLHYEGIQPENGRIVLSLKSGDYRLITTNRMPNGSQYASVSCFRLREGEERTLEMKLRRPRLADLQMKNPLPAFSLTDREGKQVESASLLIGEKSLLIFVEEGKEPTEHVLNELLSEKERLERLSCRLILAAESPSALSNPLLRHTAEAYERAQVFFDEGLENVEPVARRMYVDHERLPLLVAVDKAGYGIYACSGYHVGSVGLALRLLEMEGKE